MGEGEGGGYGAIKQNHKCEGGPAKRKPKRFLTKIVGERGRPYSSIYPMAPGKYVTLGT